MTATTPLPPAEHAWHCESCGSDFKATESGAATHETQRHDGAQTCWKVGEAPAPAANLRKLVYDAIYTPDRALWLDPADAHSITAAVVEALLAKGSVTAIVGARTEQARR